MDSITAGALIDILLVVISIATFFIGRFTASKNQGKNEGVMLTEMGYIKRSIDEITTKLDKRDKAQQEYEKEQHRRDAEYERRLQELEQKSALLEQKINMYHKAG